MLLSTGNSDKRSSNKDGSSVFNHFVVSGLIKFKRKMGQREGQELRSTKTRK